MSEQIEFFYDVGSPYSYFAAAQAEALAKETGLPVVWRPFLLGGVFKASGNQPPVSVPARAPYLMKDLQRCSAHLGLPLRMPSRFPLNTILPMRALASLPQAELPAASLKLFRGYWFDDLDISQPEVVGDLLGAHAVAEANDEAVKQKLKDNSEEAVRRGAFGAPTFFVGNEMFFGHDRIPLLKWWLANRRG
ncbi:MAG: 2-hydroxychromene-2-carboxylate isomerase [Gammaproteobacteria bacterium]